MLMLIRIAPDMFLDERFECVTINKVCEEIFHTPRFKTKYSWREKYKSKLKSLGSTIEDDPSVQSLYKIIDRLVVTAGVVNKKNGRPFDLSKTDKKIAACAASLKYAVSTVEHNLTDFLIQEFEIKVIKPLAVINYWLKKELVEWDDNKQSILEDWANCGEASQRKKDIQQFKELTGRVYPGL
ncbi:MAG: hypothetical protein WC602_01450 [archaeon]